MKRDNLHNDLRVPASIETGGIEKGEGKYSHIYFVVPKPLPTEMPEYKGKKFNEYLSAISSAK